MFSGDRSSWRVWVATLGVVAAVGVLGFLSVWSIRHAWAIYGLKDGVGGTTFYDAAGQRWFDLDEQRHDVPFDRIATAFKDAVIAVEDHRFYLHPGIDPIAVARALVSNAGGDEGMQGGSTITQQLARTLYLSNARTYGRKVQEAALALLLELILTKKEILQLYFNRVYLGAGIYGVEAMSQQMLHKHAADLTLAEAAVIAGIIRAPASYSPWTHLDAARQRASVVLQRMREEGRITEAQQRDAQAQPLPVQPQMPAAGARHGYAKEYLRQQFRAVYGGDNPPDWHVETTFVPEIQDAAEAAVRDGLRRIGIPGLQAALVALDPKTGNLLALVGGSDFHTTPFNRATRSRRQPGSAFKPFVYAAALERGYSPVSVIDGLRDVSAQTSEGVWIPRDERAHQQDTLTLREALEQSNNAAAVQLQRRVGSAPVLRLAADVGVTGQPDVPSLALGSGLVSPLDLTAAYAVFPTLGDRVRPRGLVAVRDASGSIVHQVHVERAQVLSPQVAFQMVTMLGDVVDRGTGSSARALGVKGAVGGKTGTTNDYRDAWFVGFSSSVVAGVWVGIDQPAPIADGGSGARLALPIWADFMRRTASRLPSTAFEIPPGIETREVCRLSHDRALDGCPGYVEYFKEGDAVPDAWCRLHTGSIPQQTARAIQSVLGRLGRRLAGLWSR